MATLRWRGDEVAARVGAAAKTAVDRTTAAAVTHAKQNHPWQNVTGTLEGSLQMRGAEVQGAGEIVGTWGSFDVEYAIWLEIGTSVMPPYPYLRPAADAEYPKLFMRVREALVGI